MILYCVNIWNHYQGAFCREMAALLGNEFKMVLFTPRAIVRTNHGTDPSGVKQPWVMEAPDEEWIVRPPETEDQLKLGPWNRLLADADVAIVGFNSHMSIKALKKREADGKPTFFMGERLFKRPVTWKDFFNPHRVKQWICLHRLLRGNHTYYLEISHDGWRDLRFLHVCRNRIFKWSYFPPVSLVCPQKPTNEKLRIGWCGRMIDWKHVEYIIKAVGLLPKSVRKKCDVTLIGEGPCRPGLGELAEKLGVLDVVRFETYKPIDEIADFMRGLDVYVFPSDRGEGWGVALMEAMDKGCVPIANVEAGATLDLVRDGDNGFVFRDGDIHTIAVRIQWLLEHNSKQRTMGVSAWKTIQEWSPRRGAETLLRIIDAVNGSGIRTGALPKLGLGSMIYTR